MTGYRLSRRTVLRSLGGVAAAAALGVGAWQARRFFGWEDDSEKMAGDREENTEMGPVIDTHIHVVNVNLPGVPQALAPDGTSLDAPLDEVARCIRAEMKRANIQHALCMPRRELSMADPLGVEGTRRLAALVPGLHPIGLADPERSDEGHMDRVGETLKRGDVVALKAYLGYLHHGPQSPGYRPYYQLAAKHKIPVIMHCGDTFSHLAKVKYAHPLHIDDVAVDFPETKFVIAHMGNPWLLDAAEVIYKNNKKGVRENVWADLSGLVVGSEQDFESYRQEGSLKTVCDDVRKALDFAERPDRILYGSDWPLAPMNVYRDFIRELVPEEQPSGLLRECESAVPVVVMRPTGYSDIRR
jgi:predicted TIM-barrel fold metal-dependent hydrolase